MVKTDHLLSLWKGVWVRSFGFSTLGSDDVICFSSVQVFLHLKWMELKVSMSIPVCWIENWNTFIHLLISEDKFTTEYLLISVL